MDPGTPSRGFVSQGSDLRKLTMVELEDILVFFGMAPNRIDALKRWDRVKAVRELCTNGVGLPDELAKYTRPTTHCEPSSQATVPTSPASSASSPTAAAS